MFEYTSIYCRSIVKGFKQMPKISPLKTTCKEIIHHRNTNIIYKQMYIYIDKYVGYLRQFISFYNNKLFYSGVCFKEMIDNVTNNYNSNKRGLNILKWDYPLLLPKKCWSSCRSSTSVSCRMSVQKSSTLTLCSTTSLLRSDASLVLMAPVRTIESIRSSSSQHNDRLSGFGDTRRKTFKLNHLLALRTCFFVKKMSRKNIIFSFLT